MSWKAEAERLRFNDNLSWAKIAEQLQTHTDFNNLDLYKITEKIRSYIRSTDKYKLDKADNTEDEPIYKPSIKLNKDGTTEYDRLIDICEGEDMTPEYLLSAHGLDAEKWQVVSYKNNYWHSQVKGGKRLVMYQSKITVKPYADGEISIETAKRVFAELNTNYKPKKINYITDKSSKLLEVNIADLHLGKLAWHGECGEDYDYKIALERFNYVIDDVISRVKGRGIEKIIFPVGNDFFNSDTITGTTTKGTVQTNDLRWQKMYKIGCEALTDAIDKLRHIAPVESFYVSSNHDKMVSFYAINQLAAFFRNTSDVTINTSALYRKYIEYHNTLIGFSHGSEEGKRLRNLMQTEAREAWGRTKYHEFHLAHIHSEKEVTTISEDGGLILRHVSSITGSDAWHSESGFIGAVAKAQNFIYDKDKGLVEVINSVI